MKELAPAFLYLAARPAIGKIVNSPAGVAIPLIEDIVSLMEKRNSDKNKQHVNTRSNLRYEVLVEMLVLCGLDPSGFAAYEAFIDKEIVDPRNAVAHGEDVCPTIDQLRGRRDRCFHLMAYVQATVVNGALQKAFLR